jgi:hypothetical protein
MSVIISLVVPAVLIIVIVLLVLVLMMIVFSFPVVLFYFLRWLGRGRDWGFEDVEEA